MRTLAIALLACPLIASAGTVNLIQNGSFESNQVASWAKFNSLSGWTAGALGVELRNNVSGSALDGKNFVELDTTGNSWISQTFATVVGQTYTLSFAYAQRPDQKKPTSDGKSSNGLLWSAGNVSSFLVGQDTNTAWTPVVSQFKATSSSTTLKFEAAGLSDSYGTSLDNISVTSAVPEPSSYALMLAGLGAMGLVARRRAKRNAV